MEAGMAAMGMAIGVYVIAVGATVAMLVAGAVFGLLSAGEVLANGRSHEAATHKGMAHAGA